MSYTIKAETLETLKEYYENPQTELQWRSVFSLPAWLSVWWQSFGQGYEPYLRSVWVDGKLIGIAPLMRKETTLSYMGCPDLCDYLDLIGLPGREAEILPALLPTCREEGITRLQLTAQHPDAAAFSSFFIPESPTEVPILGGLTADFVQEDVTYELPLPQTWDAYLATLNKKQRHEVRRKLRRLENETKSYRYQVLDTVSAIEAFLPTFFTLFQENEVKADFLTAQMEDYFRRLILVMATDNLARFGLLELDGHIAAVILYFDYQDRIWLYNSGFDPAYGDLSAGLLSKVFAIRDSIERGKKVFDFMKGNEVYKSRLGGIAIPIYTTTIQIS